LRHGNVGLERASPYGAINPEASIAGERRAAPAQQRR
jgi:hypothetical protein